MFSIDIWIGVSDYELNIFSGIFMTISFYLFIVIIFKFVDFIVMYV